MNYSFCHLNVSVEMEALRPHPLFEAFRTEDPLGAKPDYSISVKRVSELRHPAAAPICHLVQGIDIYMEDDHEVRLFHNYRTGAASQLLTDYGNHKELELLTGECLDCYDELDIFNAVGFEKTLSECGRFILHSAFIETPKGAILFTAPSGTGKSTQAALWEKYRGATVINGDRSCLWKTESGWMVGGIPWCGTSNISLNRIMPLRAIVILQQGPVNEILPLPAMKRISRLVEQFTVNPWNTTMYQAVQNAAIDIVTSVPVLLLSCTPDERAVVRLEDELRKYEHE